MISAYGIEFSKISLSSEGTLLRDIGVHSNKHRFVVRERIDLEEEKIVSLSWLWYSWKKAREEEIRAVSEQEKKTAISKEKRNKTRFPKTRGKEVVKSKTDEGESSCEIKKNLQYDQVVKEKYQLLIKFINKEREPLRENYQGSLHISHNPSDVVRKRNNVTSRQIHYNKVEMLIKDSWTDGWGDIYETIEEREHLENGAIIIRIFRQKNL